MLNRRKLSVYFGIILLIICGFATSSGELHFANLQETEVATPFNFCSDILSQPQQEGLRFPTNFLRTFKSKSASSFIDSKNTIANSNSKAWDRPLLVYASFRNGQQNLRV